MKPKGIPKNLCIMVFLVVSSFFVMLSSAIASELPKSKAKEMTSVTSVVGFDYKGDIEPIPADITVGIKSGKYEVTKKEYKTLDIKQKGEYVRMEGFNASTSSGDPILPVRIYEIVVPPNIDWKTLKISLEAVETVTLPGQYDILPAPPLRARVDGKEFVKWGFGKDIVDGRNMKVYGKDRFFPEQPVKIVSQSQLRKWKFVKVEFSPMQYNPVKRSLQVIQSARVRLSFTRIGKEAYRGDPLLDDKFFDEEAKSRFINFKDATEWYRYVPAPKSLKSLEADPDYVIITTNAIRDNSAKLTDFVNNKIAQGHSVGIVTEDDYGALVGQAPNGTAEKIRQWLINNYVPLGIHYVLLVGNPDPDDPAAPADSIGDIPMKMCWPDREYYTFFESPTDYFYADLTGNWDLDGDGYFGEYTSSTNPVSPDPAIDPDTFSVRWRGKINADADGTYVFAAKSTNGVRLTIDGTDVINNWVDHVLITNYGSIALTAGQHDIEVSYYNSTGDGIVTLYWIPPGSIYLNVVPSDKLYHLVAGSYVSGGLDGEYFNNSDLTNLALTRVDSNISFYWGAGDRGPGGPDFEPEVYVGRIPVYNNNYVDLDTILQKIMDYESGVAPAWRKSFLNAAVTLWEDQSDYQLGEALKKDFADTMGFTTYRVYESDFGIVPAPECTVINPKSADPIAPCNMLGEWANSGGYGLVTWSTHGWASGASGLIESADSSSLDDSVPAFSFQGSCLNGYPENTNNLGYSLLKQGAIGTVSASRVSWNAVFNPDHEPNPSWGTNAELTYHYAMRIMKDQPAGHALYLTKANVNPEGDWMNKMDYNLYGDPSAALFRTIGGVVLLFDTSGSMSWSHEGVVGVPIEKQRLSLAKEAAYPFMALLNEHANTRVNFGISVFPPHPWNWAVGCNGQTVTAMTQVNDANTNTAITGTIPNLVAEGNTPLLAGLTTAAGIFGDEKPRAIVLLSDGYHNCPNIVNSTDPEVTALINNLNASSTRVYTIGFGMPADVDHPLLTRLATDTGGKFYDVTTAAFNPAAWSPATELQATYKAILVDALGLETAVDPTGVIISGQHITRGVKINELDYRVSFFLSWETPKENRLGLKVKTSDGIEVPLTGTTPGVSFTHGKTYKVLSLDRTFLHKAGKIGPSAWTLEINPDGLLEGERENYQYSVILDSPLKMEPSFDRPAYKVGDPILLTAKMTAGGRPILGLSGVSVKMTMPKDGRGNWFAKNKVNAEELRDISEKRNGETLSLITRKALYLTEKKKIAFPGRTKPTALRMYDDGTHGDAVANDGIYSVMIAKTSVEGTYSFDFYATGSLGKGSFERDKIIQKYMEIRPSSKYVIADVTKILLDDPKIKRFRIVITPKDALGNYFGPGHTKSINVRSTKGKLTGGVKDNLDGSYTILIDLPSKVDYKQVYISGNVQDAKFSFNLAEKIRKLKM